MRVMGVDCGSERTGWSVIESDGRRHRLVEFGVIRTRTPEPMAERLRHISTDLLLRIATLKPDCGAVEDVFQGVNARSALKLAQVRGAVLLTLAQSGLAVAEYSPAQIKLCVVGHGRAEKEQVQMMVSTMLGLTEVVTSADAADAAAVAICHAVASSSPLTKVTR
jgi:crossover junction endodeoxyribonuclease RuvC